MKEHSTTALLVLLFCVAARADLFVSPAGSDANPGSEARPFATLERARDALRELKAAGQIPGREITVWLRGGDYTRTNTLEITNSDSGSAASPIVWRAFGDERVRLLGGRKLIGFVPVTNEPVLSRLDAAARTQVLQLDLRAEGFMNLGDIKSRGFGRPTAAAHSELFFRGRPMELARWPNSGKWDKLAGFPEGAGKNDDHGGNIGELSGGFLYAGERPRRWQDRSDLWVHGYWAWDWANSYERVTSLDRDRHSITTAPPYGLYGFRAGQRFYYLNVLEELDEPGEWFLDRKLGVLYFWPPSPIASGETLLSLLDQPVVRINNAQYVSFRGLEIEATRGSGIEVIEGAHNRILGCAIRNVGNLGVTISGGTDNGVADCDIFDTGDGGVSLSGGDRQNLTPADHFVENCHFQRQARWSKCYAPAVQLTGVGHRVSHNLIHEHPHCAILYTGNDHLIEFNEIYHIALETGDVGAIYTGRDYSFRGNRIRHNYLHETGGVGMGSMGVYLDDCVSGTEVVGNVFYKVHWAVFIGGGRDHRVEGNLFVDCDPSIRVDGRGLDSSPVWREMVDGFMRQQLALVPSELYRNRYPALRSLDDYYGPPGGPSIRGEAFRGVPPEGNVITKNVCIGKWIEVGWHAKLEMIEVRDNFVTADLNYARQTDGFQLPQESQAWGVGFKKIPFEKIGLRSNEDRRRLSLVR